MRNVQKLRKLYGKTQVEIAGIINYPKPLYVAFERGKMVLPEPQLKALSNFFNVSEEYLMKESHIK